MRVLRCHQDVQVCDGRGQVLRYVSGYTPKFSSSFNQMLLSDKSSDYAVARSVLRNYHPLQQEAILQMAGKRSREAMFSGRRKDILVPTA